MDEEVDIELNGTVKAVDSYLDKGPPNETPRNSSETVDLKFQRTVRILGGSVLLVLLILFAHIYRGGTNLSPEDLKGIRTDLANLEKRLWTLEEKITFLEESGKDMQQSILGAKRSRETISGNLKDLSREIGQFEKRIESIEGKRREQATKEYYEVRPGDTLYRISQKYGISLDELRRLNGLAPDHLLRPGQKLIISGGSSN
jgi:LysM repeat protein